MTTRSGKRVIAIGLDSAAPNLIERWVEEGKLPIFGRLIDAGCYGSLESTEPALTPPAWTSSVTGTNPGKHNIYDFFRVTAQHGKKMVSSKDRRSKAIWNLLDEFGKRSIILNLPLTYPAEQLNGIMVTGMPTPSLNKGFVSPANMTDEIVRLIEGKKLAVDVNKLLRGEEDQFLNDLEEVTNRISNLAFHLINTSDWDFFMVVFHDLDILQHTFWHHMDSDHPFYDEEKANTYQYAILHFYQYLEKQIERFHALLDDETVLLIFSDHGMGPIYRNFYINSFFMKRGWLKAKKQTLSIKNILRRTGFSVEQMKLLLDRTRLGGLIKRMLPLNLKTFFRKNLPAELMELDFTDWSKTLDWDNSMAYLCSRTGHGIMINTEKVADYLKFREEIIKALIDLKDPDAGHCVVKRVYKKEEVFRGPHLRNAPDILLELTETYELQEKLGKEILETVSFSRVPISANHYKEGVLILFDKHVLQQGLRLSKVYIADIAATVLYCMGLPIPQDMDGRVITEAFDKEYLKNSPIRYSDIPLQMESVPGAITPAEEEVIADRLRDLGYME